MNWKPIAPTHAIERVRIEIHFAEPLGSKPLSRLVDGVETMRAQFGFGPRTESAAPNMLLAQVGLNTGQVQNLAKMWTYGREFSPGVVVEALILSPVTLIYENAEYLRWDLMLERLVQLTSGALAIYLENVAVERFLLDYVDRFIFDGSPRTADPTPLFRPGTVAMLPPRVDTGQELWHLHRGWYELHQDIRLLVNQNLDATDLNMTDGAQRRSVTLYTKTERRDDVAGASLHQIFEHLDVMHDRCNELVGGVLSEKTCELIGLPGQGG